MRTIKIGSCMFFASLLTLGSFSVAAFEIGARASGQTGTGGSESNVEITTGSNQGQQSRGSSDISYDSSLTGIGDFESPLADAARNRTSISIGAETPKAKDAFAEHSRTYTVKEGDTLWGICQALFGDPYVWPRVWSYNMNITNPNWIYPGEIIWLVPPDSAVGGYQIDSGEAGSGLARAAARKPEANIILNRNRGFVDKEVLEKSGILKGSRLDVMLLSQLDEVYIEFKENKDVKRGDEFAAYQVLKEVNSVEDPRTEIGKLVEILGVIRIINFNKETRIATGIINESINPIERGTMVGPVHRKFDQVSPVTNEQEMRAYVIAHLDNTLLFSQHHIVFIDKGKEHGVKEGNRFFAIRKRDHYRESNRQKDDSPNYPYEVIAELTVLETRPQTSTAIVNGATRELEDGALLEMVKGY